MITRFPAKKRYIFKIRVVRTKAVSSEIESIESEVNIGFPNQDSSSIFPDLRFILRQQQVQSSKD